MSARRPWPLETRTEVLRLVDEGMTLSAAARRFGVPIGTAHQWLRDPDGSKNRARKRRYDMECVDCGGWVSGCNGHRDTPRCLNCAALIVAEANRVWIKDLVLDRIREWADIYGEPPGAVDWNPWHARAVLGDELRAARFEGADGHWPWNTVVVRVLGSWNAAIEAAGFEARSDHGGDGNQHRRRKAAA